MTGFLLVSATQGCIHVVRFASGMRDHSMVSVVLSREAATAVHDM